MLLNKESGVDPCGRYNVVVVYKDKGFVKVAPVFCLRDARIGEKTGHLLSADELNQKKFDLDLLPDGFARLEPYESNPIVRDLLKKSKFIYSRGYTPRICEYAGSSVFEYTKRDYDAMKEVLKRQNKNEDGLRRVSSNGSVSSLYEE